MIDVPNAIIFTGNDAFQDRLAFNQRKAAQIAAIEPEHVKGQEVRPVATKEQVVESAATVRAKTCDLAVKHGTVPADGVRKFRTQVGP